MKRWITTLAVAATLGAGLATAAIAGPAVAQQQAAPYCGITWGSLPKSAATASTAPMTNVRAGRHDCYDRLVVDVSGDAAGYTVRYVDAVRAQGSGNVIPLRGGAFLQIDLTIPAYDPNTGSPTYSPANPDELVNLGGYRTFRQSAWGGSFEGYTTIGLGVRARLPFRVFDLDGPGSGSRLVIDVAHKW